MRKILFAILLLFITCYFSCGNATQDNTKLDNALLWKISGNGLKEPSYLFGTLHSTCKITLDNSILKALEETNMVYLEIDPEDPEIPAAMQSGRDMKNGKRISTMISKEDYEMLDAFLKENNGKSLEYFDTFKPEFIHFVLTSKILDCPDGTKSYEQEITDITKAKNKEISGLESPYDQIGIYDTIPYEVQLEGLLKSARSNLSTNKEKAKKMMQLYADKNIEGLTDFIKKSDNKTYSRYSHIILDNRNIKWISKIEKASKEKPTFFAFGVTHLAGKKGVINLLKEKGYRVEPVY